MASGVVRPVILNLIISSRLLLVARVLSIISDRYAERTINSMRNVYLEESIYTALFTHENKGFCEKESSYRSVKERNLHKTWCG